MWALPAWELEEASGRTAFQAVAWGAEMALPRHPEHQKGPGKRRATQGPAAKGVQVGGPHAAAAAEREDPGAPFWTILGKERGHLLFFRF